MMDAEKVQKINALALELYKKGLVSDREEAVKEAERLLGKQDYSYIKETMKGIEEDTEKTKPGKEEELSQEKVKDILEKNTVFLMKKMKEYEEQMEKFREEIGSLKSEVSTLKLSGSQVQREAKRPQQKLEGEKEEGHPRSGKYKGEDVSIEKFFNYSGSSKK